MLRRRTGPVLLFVQYNMAAQSPANISMQKALLAGLRGAAIANYHGQRLRDIAAYAKRSSPFYATALDDFVSGRGFDQKAWSTIPIIDRRAIATAAAEMRVPLARLPKDAGEIRTAATSGTTGQPLQILINKLADIFSQVKYRAYFADWGISTNKTVLTVRLPKSQERSKLGQLTTKPLPGAPGVEFTLFSLDIDRVLEAATECQPDYLRAYPGVVHASAVAARRSGRAVTFDLIMTVGETLHDDVRAFIEETFKCRVADAYAAEEFGLIGYACPRCNNYHLTHEGLFVELLDDEGAPVRIGETGRIVVTSLYNYAMPLIRYETGDYATRGHARGRCSEKGLMLRRIEGRERNLFRLPGGGQVWPMLPAAPLFELGVEEFRVVQTDLRSITVLYRASAALPGSALAALVHQYLSPEYEVLERLVDSLDGTGSGKRAMYVSEIEQ